MKSKKKKNGWLVWACIIAYIALIVYFAIKGIWAAIAVGVWMFFVYIGLGICAIAKQADQRTEDIFNREIRKRNESNNDMEVSHG